MRKLRKIACVTLAAALSLAAIACGDEDDAPSGGKGGASSGGASSGGSNSGGTSSEGGKSTGGKSGTGGRASGGRTSTGGSPSAEGGATVEGGAPNNTGGQTAEGGSGPGPVTCNIYDEEREVVEIPTDDDGNLDAGSEDRLVLTSDKTWKLSGRVFVPSGVTLEIEPCTLIVGTPKPNAGALFIMRGAKLEAQGSAEAPIVFSSQDYRFRSNAPWGGLVLLGQAPIGQSDAAQTDPERVFEGLTDTRAAYGGSDEDDSSGSLSYVRIEYGGDIVVADKEINGLTLAGVGRGTQLDHIMVKRTMDDCFEFFGGTVNADHLICENPGDDMFDTDEKYRGHLQYLFGRIVTPGSSADPNGFEWDGNQPNFATVTERGTPRVSNATLCGLGEKGSAVGNGAVLRRGLQSGTSLLNTIITGFDRGVDTRDAVGTNEAPVISWTHSLFFDNFVNNTAPETEATDNDSGFDEAAWLGDAGNNNGTDKPEGFDCYADPPAPFPSQAIEGGRPDAPFERNAEYVGAFENADDNWMTGAWVDFSAGD